MYPVSKFQQVLYTVVLLTILSGSTAVYIAAQPQPSKEQVKLCDTFAKVFVGGTVTVFGLLARRK
jgi:hypothetical protein